MEHSYTKSGLSFGLLKNKDRSIAEVLRKVADEHDFELQLGSVVLHRDGYNNDDDYDGNNFDFEDGGESYYISNFIDRHGKTVKSSRRTIDSTGENSFPNETIMFDFAHCWLAVYPDAPWIGRKPDDESTEPTGNEGTSISLRYNLAILIIFPKNRALSLLFEEGPEKAAEYLRSKLEKCDPKSSRDTTEWKDCIEAAKKILYHYRNNPSLASKIYQMLITIGDKELVNQYLSNAGQSSVYSYNNTKNLVEAKKAFGWDPILSYLKSGRNSN